jgi:hypothetical protein
MDRASLADTLRVVDQLLRGGFTGEEALENGRIEANPRALIVGGIVLGSAYGFFMGLFAAIRGGPFALLQVLSTMVKVPLLFLATLVVTFPSLYVFSALSRSRLSFAATLRLLLAAIAVNLTLLASFGPVTGFFTLSTDSYPFMIVLNVVFFAVAGLVGLSFLQRALQIVFREKPALPDAPGRPAAPSGEPQPAVLVFRVWTIIYGVVGAQMGWILRPFIGDPHSPFQLFRARQSNFFEAVWHALGALL